MSHILLSIDKYQELTGGSENIIDMLAMPDVDDYTFQALDGTSFKTMEFD